MVEYEFFIRKFARQQVDPSEMKVQGEKMIRNLLAPTFLPADALNSIVNLRKGLYISSDFFNQPEILNKLVILLTEQYLNQGFLPNIQHYVTDFGLPKTIYAKLDQELASRKFQENQLATFLSLVDSANEQALFPLAMPKIKEAIIEALPANSFLATWFVTKFYVYKNQTWAKENLAKAIEHPKAAKTFLEHYEKDRRLYSWTGEPRVRDIVRRAEQVFSQYSIELLKSSGGTGFSKEDEFATHFWRFGETDAVLVDSIRKILTGTDFLTTPASKSSKVVKHLYALKVSHLGPRDVKEWQSDVDDEGIEEEPKQDLVLTPEAYECLLWIQKDINKSHELFIADFLINFNIPEADKRALVNNGANGAFKMNDLLPNVRGFISRYIVQKAEGKAEKMDSAIIQAADEVQKLLKLGFDKYIGAYQVDIPLYDILYEEFDNLRVAGRKPREVYLGRDGIFAYIGRRAQDAMRRVQENKAVKARLAERKEGTAINPLYLVYPSYFRDSINYETKKAFLEQERVSQDTDPIFYDTGYSGSIPEQIMQIMGFSREEIEKRIRLLSARKSNRRLRGAGDDIKADAKAVEYIENNPQTEESARGLVRDHQTGLIRHIAEPTTPEDQFVFSMIKQAIARHYMVKEATNVLQTNNVSLDFPKHTAVVNKDFATLLPQSFLTDPENFLWKYGQRGVEAGAGLTDTGSDIFFLKLADNTDVAVKIISTGSLEKDAHGEFVFLGRAKKLGLATAEPIGFIAGKKEGEPSFLLMKKIEGIPGGELEKHLKESGRYTDDQIRTRLSTVAHENNRLAQVFRQIAKIDKEWRIEDLMIQLNEETGGITAVVPIDWSEIANIDLENLKKIYSEPERVEVL